MTVRVEITCSISQEPSARAAVEAFNNETGGLRVGRRVNEQSHKVQLMVRLPQSANVSNYAAPLGQAHQQKVFESFRFVIGELVSISFAPSVNLQEQMRDFPLRPDETWFPAIDDPHKAYVCMSMPVMLAKQAAWLLAHEVEWAYV